MRHCKCCDFMQWHNATIFKLFSPKWKTNFESSSMKHYWKFTFGNKVCILWNIKSVWFCALLLQDPDTMIASHVLVFMAVGVNNNLKQSLGYFGTQTATSDVLYPLLWEAVAYLEQQGLKVFDYSVNLTCGCGLIYLDILDLTLMPSTYPFL